MNKIINLLNRVLNSTGRKLKKQNEYMYWSPFVSHHKPKLQINIQTGKWHCWVSNQGGHNLFQLFKKVGASKQHFDELVALVDDIPRYKQNKDSKKETVQLPKEFKPLWNGGNSIIKRHSLNYLNKRNITYEDIIKYNIGYCDVGLYTNRVIIPSYDSEGELNFFVGRDFYKSKMKYRNSPTTKDVIGFELFINWDEPIVLVEGPLDAITVKRNCIPLFGKTIMSNLYKQIMKNNVKTIYICLDNDAMTDSLKMVENLLKEEIDIYLIRLDQKDPNEVGFKNFIRSMDNTKKMSFSNLIRYKLNDKSKKYMEI